MLLFEFQFCSGNTESALLVTHFTLFYWYIFLQAEQRVGEQNQVMASKSRPSQRPACTTRRMMASSPTPAPSSPTPGRGPVHDSALPLLLLLPTVAAVADWSMHGG